MWVLLAGFSAVAQAQGVVRVALSSLEIGVEQDSAGRTVFDGVHRVVEGGKPALPLIPVTVLLPPGAHLETLRVTIENPVVEEVPGEWIVAAASAPRLPPSLDDPGSEAVDVWPAGAEIVDGRDMNIYGTDAYFPERFAGHPSGGQLREWWLADIQVFPYRYNPIQRKLLRLAGGTLVFRFDLPEEPYEFKETNQRLWLKNRAFVEGKALNFQQASPVYHAAAEKRWSLPETPESPPLPVAGFVEEERRVETQKPVQCSGGTVDSEESVSTCPFRKGWVGVSGVFVLIVLAVVLWSRLKRE